MVLATLCATLTACAHGGASPSVPSNPDPVIERRTELRLVCPAELNIDLGPRPQVPADAVVTHNASGGQYLDAIAARGARAEDLLGGAKAECDRQKTAQPAPAAPPASPASGAQ